MLSEKQAQTVVKINANEKTIFSLIASDIKEQGYSILPEALPAGLANSLSIHQQNIESEKFKKAGVGRGNEYLKNEFVRSDEICWIEGDNNVEKQWLDWMSNLQRFLNRHLFLGLDSFESHFAHYKPGDYYTRHYDTFRGQSNRVLSIVAYFNSNWTRTNGGELVLYTGDNDKSGLKVNPALGTLVTFLSEDFPHEVLAANRDRYSIAGWLSIKTKETF